jgi:hypothetical protein
MNATSRLALAALLLSTSFVKAQERSVANAPPVGYPLPGELQTDTDAVGDEAGQPKFLEAHGLEDLLGVALGAPFAEASTSLLGAGFLPDTVAASEQIASASDAAVDFARSASGRPDEGLVVNWSLVPTSWGMQRVRTHATLHFRRVAQDVVAEVELTVEALPGPQPGDHSLGRVIAVEVFQGYDAVVEPVNWLLIEAKLRQAAVAEPTCETLSDRVTLAWLIEDGLSAEPQANSGLCEQDFYAGAAAPDAVLSVLLSGAEVSVPPMSSLIVQIEPGPPGGWVWMSRRDASLQAEAIAAVVKPQLAAPPVAVGSVEF